MQFRIRLIEADQQFFCDADQTIFAAALAHGLTMLSSCRNGTCRTCMCQLKSGQVRYQVEWPGL
ncbi:MAG: 2Fe-2S iron-sulfur cluster binding domain-containing protein, partial [Burkholderiales bacterium]|nr:2Fe-2S iron-sulfur cluster binding domain-containing protein [Burkholderiales bacterium]